MDHATGGRFILGLGAGWYEPEHTPFGIPFPPMPRAVRSVRVAASHVIRALFSDAAGDRAGVTRAEPVLSARRGHQRSAAADPGRAADLARRPEAPRDRPRRRGGPGLAPAGGTARQDADGPGLLRRSARCAACARWPRSAAIRPGSPSSPRSRPARRRPTRQGALAAGPEAARTRRDAHHRGHRPRSSGAAGVDAVAEEVAQPLRAGLDELASR